MRQHLTSACWWLSSVLIFGFLWEILSRIGILDTYILPPPSVFLRQTTLPISFGLGENQEHSPIAMILLMILSSSSRVLAGMLLGLVGALPCGILMGRIPIVERLVAPVFTLLAPLAPLAWIPLILISIGTGNAAAVIVVFVGVFFLLTLATLNSVKNVDPRYLQLAESLGANKFSQIVHVVIPASLPNIFFILRVNFFAAWMAVLTAEGIGITKGLGALVIVARATANVNLMLTAMLLIACCGTFIDWLLRLLQVRLFGWHTETLMNI